MLFGWKTFLNALVLYFACVTKQPVHGATWSSKMKTYRQRSGTIWKVIKNISLPTANFKPQARLPSLALHGHVQSSTCRRFWQICSTLCILKLAPLGMSGQYGCQTWGTNQSPRPVSKALPYNCKFHQNQKLSLIALPTELARHWDVRKSVDLARCLHQRFGNLA